MPRWPRIQRRTKIQGSKKDQNINSKKAPILLRTFTEGFGHSFWLLFDVWFLIFLWCLGVLVLGSFLLVPVLAFIQALKKFPGFSSHFGVPEFILHFKHEVAAFLRGLKYHRQYLLASFEEKHVTAEAAIGFWLFFATKITGQFGNSPGIGSSDHVLHRISTRHIEGDHKTVAAGELSGNG